MGRRSSGGSGFFRKPSGGAPPRSATAAAPPKQAPSASPAQPGFGRIMMEGVAFGAGSEVAHQAIRGVMGSGLSEGPAQQAGSTFPCSNENQSFMSCLQHNKSDISQCQSYLDLFKQCKGAI